MCVFVCEKKKSENKRKRILKQMNRRREIQTGSRRIEYDLKKENRKSMKGDSQIHFKYDVVV